MSDFAHYRQLRAEEELLNQERAIMFQQLEEMKAIRAHLEVQHSSAENSRRLDLPNELRAPCFDDRSEQLRVW